MLVKSTHIFIYSLLMVVVVSCSNYSGKKFAESDVVENSVIKQPAQNKSGIADSLTFSKAALADIYSLAIADFIKAAHKNNKTTFDTLYFGKRAFGSSDDFPDIELPQTIEKTEIRLVAPEEFQSKQAERKSLVYVNLIGWVESDKAEFIFVIFSNGGKHQYDYFLNYTYNITLQQFELTKVKFELYTETND
jgi:hypothetical protein